MGRRDAFPMNGDEKNLDEREELSAEGQVARDAGPLGPTDLAPGPSYLFPS